MRWQRNFRAFCWDGLDRKDGSVPNVEQKVEDGCFLPPLTIVHSALTNSSDLAVAPIGKKEYRSACSAVHTQKWPEAEQHLRKAVEQNPKYAAAWVTLGQVLQALLGLRLRNGS